MLAMLPVALAGFNPSSGKNVAVYWGQNSYNQGSGPLAQQRLSYYCSNTNIDIIPVAFMNGITPPITNFANAGDNCTAFPDNKNVLSCPQIEADIKGCQTNGKTIILSLGGATYTQGGWGSASAAQTAAQMVWDMFGPVPSGKTVDRPFGSAVVDGFDFDFESTASNLPAFAQKLRSLMDAAGGKKFYLTAAPQCVFPDAANGAALNAVGFDFLMIQFYNNWCGVSNFNEGSTTQNAFNFDVWDNWAKTTSPNKNVKLLIGVPAAPGAGGGYTSGSKLKAAIQWSKAYSNFGGAMMWDMSQLYSNSGFLNEIVSDLAGGATPTTTTTTPGGGTTTTTTATTTPTGTTPTPTGSLVPHWGQCGGQGYTGPTQCQPPYKCVNGGQWWSSCQ
ncbi:class III chitinase [Purpureocillium lavendulum]|uniref:chitinase n=1 Tax=Purpureocillium lavendulum TaxID=1247861 RepID=A0AB34FJM3_9HYPO|nr:class III chitinase [Purpureocillium lavendulum]